MLSHENPSSMCHAAYMGYILPCYAVAIRLQITLEPVIHRIENRAFTSSKDLKPIEIPAASVNMTKNAFLNCSGVPILALAEER